MRRMGNRCALWWELFEGYFNAKMNVRYVVKEKYKKRYKMLRKKNLSDEEYSRLVAFGVEMF